MKVRALKIPDVYVVETQPTSDERGLFARTFCQDDFMRHGMNGRVVQCNTSFNERRGTLRGMHLQAAPMAETKLVRCTRGAIFDVVVDVRRHSPTFCQWEGVELSADDRRALYIPEGCAHGFQTLTDGAEVLYLMGQFYSPAHARGVRWNDPAFHIQWPISAPILSTRDAQYADFVR